MSKLSVTLIDVGWGDSIFIESVDSTGKAHYALVDCNDTTYNNSAYLFIKRFLERKQVKIEGTNRLFDFILLTHGHDDHANGIQAMMKNFKTDWFWYPKSVEYGGVAKIIKYANQNRAKVNQHQAIDNTKILPPLGDAQLKVLWPPYNPTGPFTTDNENNNSIVLALTLANVSFILTGDCEAENWHQINANLTSIPGIAMFKVPHHGAINGVFDQNNTPWLNTLPATANLAISSHIRPYNHPAPKVVAEFDRRHINPFRTDLHYHLTFTTDGTSTEVQWSHV